MMLFVRQGFLAFGLSALLVSMVFGVAGAERSVPRLFIQGGVDVPARSVDEWGYDYAPNLSGQIEFPLAPKASAVSILEYHDFPERSSRKEEDVIGMLAFRFRSARGEGLGHPYLNIGAGLCHADIRLFNRSYSSQPPESHYIELSTALALGAGFEVRFAGETAVCFEADLERFSDAVVVPLRMGILF